MKSFAVTAFPSDHLASSLKWKVYSKPSSDTSQDSAAPGLSTALPSPSSSHLIRPSKACPIIIAPSTEVFLAGSIDSGSEAKHTSIAPSSTPTSSLAVSGVFSPLGLPSSDCCPSTGASVLSLPPQAVKLRAITSIRNKVIFFFILNSSFFL